MKNKRKIIKKNESFLVISYLTASSLPLMQENFLQL